ncbi:30S ribosomal protein S16 [candidate division WOR-1 bacterium RIFOXYA12_FULL_52_29]|uniref:Small ribosomal subunit protein bS16 n=1 Tax=candidate division WOR-1 bacterium RIFOXYC12_FULL_54_18 TaxID=1802584 RepID=A0A1F4T761_UNCSA|nr:MAG: 30S ribosomal protein S16 [candidate division WOR-1 bacterium RIFOXYA2_FULL_51_19]OGC17942.1 MAG: 30S ribosomal protein S16 [candidate division WOR-1 bacterium RIFOXYA12_FULL_52_29]OGC26799.1 MAG: 30S ribosomal protein S16 [candidate division WOR-1 bacterium RIFOXYB2_FULL_45_9]OGC28359.1 MAG: 30S ribosomal protein S16 [candidate division WOR-1 bacterium RIFOXYC12_FULL_54_18]OGC31185.1 MAG: 30S ribosomal protein S16 [candidate division WOR-1 bacterium RIFOXYB12_FULL_52_16]
MAAKIKLQRVGTKNRPVYRLVVQDESRSPSSAVINVLGNYQPGIETPLFNLKDEQIKEWLKKGAQPTEKVRILLGKAGIMSPIDLASLPKRKSKKEVPAAPAEAKAAEEKAQGG